MQFYTTVDLTSTNDVVQNLGHEVAYYSGNPRPNENENQLRYRISVFRATDEISRL